MDRRDLVGGLVFGAVRAVFLFGALGYEMGSARRMGPGYFPFLAGIGAVAAAAAIVLPALLRQPAPPILVEWRPMIMVLAAIAGFAVAIDRLGLLPAITLTVVLAALADRNSTILGTIGLAAILCAGSWLVFIAGLGLQIPTIRMP